MKWLRVTDCFLSIPGCLIVYLTAEKPLSQSAPSWTLFLHLCIKLYSLMCHSPTLIINQDCAMDQSECYIQQSSHTLLFYTKRALWWLL
ncbi:hypothetical protein FKM82_023157 [Ascaphus truei]